MLNYKLLTQQLDLYKSRKKQNSRYIRTLYIEFHLYIDVIEWDSQNRTIDPSSKRNV